MVSLTKKVNFILILFLLSSCNKNLIGLRATSDVNSIPGSFENPLSQDIPPSFPAPDLPRTPEKTHSPQSSSNKPDILTEVPASHLVTVAQKIINTEARQLGTACNLFVHRVLSLAGFPDHTYLANDFQLYAQKYFKHVRTENFRIDPKKVEVIRLRKYIESYPERTPFIFQWRRSGKHGHIAFIERIQDKLVIYQASLGTQIPKKNQTNYEFLLNSSGRSNLIVYSEMEAN